MSIFAVIIHDPDAGVGSQLEQAYPEREQIQLAPNIYLVSGDLLITDIVERIGLKEEPSGGVVFRLNGTYSGRTYPRVWDWLARAATHV